MTQDELDGMPDVTDQAVALFQKEEDGTVEDLYGVTWMTGWLNGIRVKRRFGVMPLAVYARRFLRTREGQ